MADSDSADDSSDSSDSSTTDESEDGGGARLGHRHSDHQHGRGSILAEEDPLTCLYRRALANQRKVVEETGQLFIFLSSPFNGLRDERDIFINRYLPLLRSQAENKGVMVKVIDLRWGISTQQSADGMTLTICLSGVRETNLFLGFYGARYGTV